MKGVIRCYRELLAVWNTLTGTCCISIQPVWIIACCKAYLTWMHNKSWVSCSQKSDVLVGPRHSAGFMVDEKALGQVFLSGYFRFYLYTTLYQCSVLIHSSLTLCNRKSFTSLNATFRISVSHTGCFTTLGYNCRRWFTRSLWSKKFI